jgi:hypothetical protein
MVYKADFRPAEVLGPDGAWRPLERQVDGVEALGSAGPNPL